MISRICLALALAVSASISAYAQNAASLEQMGINGKYSAISYKYTKYTMRYGKPVADRPYVQMRQWFDKAGRVVKAQWLDEKERVTMRHAYAYDKAGRLDKDEYELSGMATGKYRTQYVYDSLGRLSSEDGYIVPDGRLQTRKSYEYDSLGRLTSAVERLYFTSGGSTVHIRTQFVHTDSTYTGVEHQYASDGWVADSRAKTWTTAGVLIAERDTTYSHEGEVLSRFQTLYNDRGWLTQREHRSDYGAGPLSWIVTYQYKTDKKGDWTAQESYMLDRTTDGAVPELRGRVERQFK